MTILFPMAVNKPGAPSVPPLENSTPPDAVYCFLLAMKREPMMGNGGSAPPKVRTCHRSVSGGGGGSLTPEQLSCPARGGARSGSGGW